MLTNTEDITFLKMNSKRSVNAIHLNKIETNNLEIRLERINKEHNYFSRKSDKELLIAQNQLRLIHESTGHIRNEIFNSSKFKQFIKPIGKNSKKKPMLRNYASLDLSTSKICSNEFLNLFIS